MSGPAALALSTVVGFAGTVPGGLKVHPDGEHIIYPLGSTLVVRSIRDSTHLEFLTGHTDKIMSVAMSKSGRYLATGQRTHMGYQADLIIWDFERRSIMHRLTLHKVVVQSLSFSPDEALLASVGGQDDNQLVLWDVVEGRAVCGSTAANDMTYAVAFFNTRNDMLISVGNYNVRVWEVDVATRKLMPTDASLGGLRRLLRNVIVDSYDDFAYCGTTTGEVMQFQLRGPKNLKNSAPQKKKFEQGVCSLEFNPRGDIVIGAGDGTVAILDIEAFRITQSSTVMGAVMSISVHPDGYLFVGTSQSTIYTVNGTDLSATAFATCHFEKINDVAFPPDFSGVFATCSMGDARLWNSGNGQELLRIQVPNVECNCVAFSMDGKAVISGWSDGKIRAFGPKSGKLLYTINDAHRIMGQKRISGNQIGVTALAVCHDGERIMSGGSDHQVRVWRIGAGSQSMLASLKEHKATINSIKIRANDSEAVSASDDGSCIVWDLSRYNRANILNEHTYFKDVCYLPDESQMITAGTDKKVVYWDSVDCSAIRELEAADGELMTCDVSATGQYFASAGNDSIVKLWDYELGECLKIGVAHSGGVSRLRFSPDGRMLVSVGNEGGICLWVIE